MSDQGHLRDRKEGNINFSMAEKGSDFPHWGQLEGDRIEVGRMVEIALKRANRKFMAFLLCINNNKHDLDSVWCDFIIRGKTHSSIQDAKMAHALLSKNSDKSKVKFLCIDIHYFY